MTKAQAIMLKYKRRLIEAEAQRMQPVETPPDDKFVAEEDKPENKLFKEMREIDQMHSDHVIGLKIGSHKRKI